MPVMKSWMSVTAGLILVLCLASGDSFAQIFFVQGEAGPKGDTGDAGQQGIKGLQGDKGDAGEKGPTGDAGPQGDAGPKGDSGIFAGFTGDVVFDGGFNATVHVKANNLTVTGSYVLPECPEGYTKDPRTDITLCTRGTDQMVRVGDFWMDRYEAIVVDTTYWSGGLCNGAGTQYGDTDDWSTIPNFPYTGNWSVKLYACSKSGVKPSAFMTWFQAQEACALSDKRLCTNEEWQAAAAGTVDTGGTEIGTQCHLKTTNVSARKTGLAGSTPGGTDSCISKWGTEDMFGNLWEWVAMWGQAGPDNGVTNGEYAGTVGSGKGWDGFSPETSGNGDGTWNLAGVAQGCDKSGSNCGYKVGLPFAAFRGGYWGDGGMAGLFAFRLDSSPSDNIYGYSRGFRCCRGR